MSDMKVLAANLCGPKDKLKEAPAKEQVQLIFKEIKRIGLTFISFNSSRT